MTTQQAPTQTPAVPNFTLDYWWGTHSFPAVGYGPRWNGWVTPIVTRETLEKFRSACENDEEIMESLREQVGEYEGKMLEWEGDSLWLDGTLLSPSEDGTYSFGFIGWTFIHDQEDLD